MEAQDKLIEAHRQLIKPTTNPLMIVTEADVLKQLQAQAIVEAERIAGLASS
jgi:hypothetical protein